MTVTLPHEASAIKIALDRRNMLTLLLSNPARISICPPSGESDGVGLSLTTTAAAVASAMGDEHGIENQMIRRLAAYLNSNSSIQSFPAHEIKSILRALAEECHCTNIQPQDDDVILDIRRASNKQQNPPETLPPPCKRRKRISINNNLHSVLRLVGKIIHQRYTDTSRSLTSASVDEDSKFLDIKSIGYFGTQDASFQIEEGILTSAFEIAMNAIVHLVDADDVAPGELSPDGMDIRPTIDVAPTVRVAQGRKHNMLHDGVIQTALEIINAVVAIDRRERNIRIRIQRRQQATNMNGPMSSSKQATSSTTDRRKKYEHLLRTGNCRDHCNDETKQVDSPTSITVEVKSIMELKYPKQWEWLCRWREAFDGNKIAAEDIKVHKSSNNSGNPEYEVSPSNGEKDDHTSLDSNIVIIRRRIESIDDMSLSSDDGDDVMNDKATVPELHCHLVSLPSESKCTPTTIPETEEALPSPLRALDQETHELRLTLLDMPPSESSSMEIIRHTVDELHNLLQRYGELDGAAGIGRCGDIMGGTLAIENRTTNDSTTNDTDRFPLNEAMVSSLVTTYLTDATGALRAKAFLRSFVLPLMLDMNPNTELFTVGNQQVPQNEGKPASRMLTSLLASLARDRPIECVESIVVPTLLSRRQIPFVASASTITSEPSRFQCELMLRILRGGKDALPIPAIALLVEEILPTKEVDIGMKWTDNTMPVLTTCLNRQPSLPDDVIVKLADEISLQLSSTQSLVAKSVKFSTLFHAFVTKYGPHLTTVGKVESLKESSTRLQTFMSKTIALALKKLS